MFSLLLKNILNEYAGEYIEGLNKEQLSVGVSKGEFELRDVRLRCDTITRALGNLPVALSSARVGTLRLRIPYQHLQSESTTIVLRDLLLVVSPHAVDLTQPGESLADFLKQQRLNASELITLEQRLEAEERENPSSTENAAAASSGIGKEAGEEEEDDEEGGEEHQSIQSASTTHSGTTTAAAGDTNRRPPRSSYPSTGSALLDKMIKRITDNISIHIENLTLRYEDSSTLPGQPFAFSCHLEELKLQSADENFQVPFVFKPPAKSSNPAPAKLRRHVHIKGLSVSRDAMSTNTSLSQQQPQQHQHLGETGSAPSTPTSAPAVGILNPAPEPLQILTVPPNSSSPPSDPRTSASYRRVGGGGGIIGSFQRTLPASSSSFREKDRGGELVATTTSGRTLQTQGTRTGSTNRSDASSSQHGASSRRQSLDTHSSSNVGAAMLSPVSQVLLLFPVEATLQLTQSEQGLSLNGTLGKLHLQIDDSTYRHFAILVERVSAHEAFITQSSILRLRPVLSPEEDPRAWWRFAIQSIRVSNQEANAKRLEKHGRGNLRKPDWTAVIRMMDDRDKYVGFYKRRLISLDAKFQRRAKMYGKGGGDSGRASNKRPTSTGTEGAREEGEDTESVLMEADLEEDEKVQLVLRGMERGLTYDEILLYRSFANAEYKEERLRLKRLHHSRKFYVRALRALTGTRSTPKLAQGTLLLSNTGTSGNRSETVTSSKRFSFFSRKKSSGVPSEKTLLPPRRREEDATEEKLERGEENWALTSTEKQALYENIASQFFLHRRRLAEAQQRRKSQQPGSKNASGDDAPEKVFVRLVLNEGLAMDFLLQEMNFLHTEIKNVDLRLVLTPQAQNHQDWEDIKVQIGEIQAVDPSQNELLLFSSGTSGNASLDAISLSLSQGRIVLTLAPIYCSPNASQLSNLLHFAQVQELRNLAPSTLRALRAAAPAREEGGKPSPLEQLREVPLWDILLSTSRISLHLWEPSEEKGLLLSISQISVASTSPRFLNVDLSGTSIGVLREGNAGVVRETTTLGDAAVVVPRFCPLQDFNLHIGIEFFWTPVLKLETRTEFIFSEEEALVLREDDVVAALVVFSAYSSALLRSGAFSRSTTSMPPSFAGLVPSHHHHLGFKGEVRVIAELRQMYEGLSERWSPSIPDSEDAVSLRRRERLLHSGAEAKQGWLLLCVRDLNVEISRLGSSASAMRCKIGDVALKDYLQGGSPYLTQLLHLSELEILSDLSPLPAASSSPRTQTLQIHADEPLLLGYNHTTGFAVTQYLSRLSKVLDMDGNIIRNSLDHFVQKRTSR
jgi:hypothetical protein